jgi:hypothetical protein
MAARRLTSGAGADLQVHCHDAHAFDLPSARRRRLVAPAALAQTGPRMHTRKIPRPAEAAGGRLRHLADLRRRPAPGERAPRAEVLKALFEAGGSVIDSSPMYGKAEGVVGDLLAESGTRDKASSRPRCGRRVRDAGIARWANRCGAAHRPCRADANPQPGRLEHAPADPAGLEGEGRIA